jgi:hypothetical protein
MEKFGESGSGRLAALAVSLPLIEGGWLGWSTEGNALGWMVATLTAAIILGIFAVGLAVERYPYHAVGMVLVLLPALFLYLPMVAIVRPNVPFFGSVMVAAGAMMLALSARTILHRVPASTASRQGRSLGTSAKVSP